MRGKYLLVIGLFAICLILVSAIFTTGDLSHSVSTKYLKDSYLNGWVNLSFDLEPLNSIFKDSLGNSVGLEEILNSSENSGFNYECNVEGCAEDYEASNPETSKTFDLASGKTKLIGLKLEENILGINSVEFDLESDAGASCNNQVKIDILDDGEIDFLNTKLSGILCPDINKGCFDNSASSEEISISTTPICQRINFTEAPKYQAGAWIKQITLGSKNIWMQVFNLEGAKLEECLIKKEDISASGVYVSCNINLTVLSPRENYVCLVSDSGSGEYKARGYNPPEPCGFAGIPPQTETSAYDIYIQKRKYDAVGVLYIPDDLPVGESFGELVENYIVERYGSLNCSGGCVIPIKIISGTDQKITLKYLDLNYNKVGLPGVSENNFYDASKTSAKISTDKFQKLYLNNKFLLPNTPGDILYTLRLNNQDLFTENITIKNLSISLSPLKAAAEIETEFEITISPEENITSYGWDFGDGTVRTTNITKTKYKYSNIENYTLIITINYNENESISKDFIIEVGAPKDYINSIINEIKGKLNEINGQINNFDFFVKSQIEEILELNKIQEKIENISQEIVNVSDEKILEIVRDLQNIQIPDNLITSSTNEIIFYPSEDSISLDALSQASGENYSSFDEQDYINAILFWNQDSFETKVSTLSISSQTGNLVLHLLTVFEMNFDNKKNSEPYLIIEDLENLVFEKDLIDLGTHKYVQINSNANNMKFSTTENLNFENLPAFISPGFSELNLEGTEPGVIIEEKPSKKNWIWVLIFGIILVGLIVYVYLHQWYKTKYENKLFKSQNNLYNLSHYINNSRANGMNDFEIRKNLKKTGWNAEQVRYVMRKYSGKNTGMYDLFPFLKKKETILQNNNSNKTSINAQQKTKPQNITFQKRNPLLVFVLTLITFGIYYIVWLVLTTKELRKFTKKAPNPNLLWLILIPGINIIIVLIYNWKYGDALNEITGANGFIVFVLMTILSPIGLAIAQSKLNKNSSPNTQKLNKQRKLK